MRAPRRRSAVLVACLCLAALTGCSAGPTASAPPAGSSQPAAAASPPPALRNVTIDPDRATGADIGPDGGSVAATGANGVAYTLTLAPHSVPATTRISLYPVTGVAGLATGSSIAAGVQFGPDGLILEAPATLTIRLPAGLNAASLSTVAWRGDGVRPHLYPSGVEGQEIKLTILHFSGVGLNPDQIATSLSCDEFDYACVNDKLEQDLVSTERLDQTRVRLTVALRAWYAFVIDPVMTADLASFTGHDATRPWTSDLQETFAYYGAWRSAIFDVGEFLGDPRFTVLDVGASEAQLAAVLRAYAGAMNFKCGQDKDRPDPSSAVGSAELGIRLPFVYAAQFNLETPANGLDEQTLLDQSCVQVVIDPSRDYSGNEPGDLGTVTVPTGFTIAGGPLRHDLPILVRFSVTGEATPFAQNAAAADGSATASLAWPPGADPIKVDVLARLATFEDGAEVMTDLSRFDRITRAAQRLVFPFDTDLEGWTRGTIGPKGSADWGTVYWLPQHGGTVQLDGTGDPVERNAWISHVFVLPRDTTTLSFDVSAHDRHGADASFKVRIIDGAVSTAIVNEIVTHLGREGDLSFQTQTVDISAWAGRTVTIVFEQNDNGIHGTFPGGDEQVHLDNIRILRG
ncbi:MAG TPA: hypothetical protein VGJ17_06800 [Candidatus Limnocylindrales bacterium]